MKRPFASIARQRGKHIVPLALFMVVLVLALAASAWAQSTKSGSWPTTKWVVMDRQGSKLTEYGAAGYILDWASATFIPPLGDRAVMAEKHRRTLEAGSIWYRSLGFPPPFQRTEGGDLEVDPGEAYLALLKQDANDNGSSHVIDGEMRLTSHPGFLSADTPLWELMEASVVHELYHGIQKTMSPSFLARNASEPSGWPELPECPGDTNVDWLFEGVAAMVQIRWLEGKHGVSWGHPFRGSHRAAWVRHFDQPLHEGSIPPERRYPKERLPVSTMETVSWACDYGTWYFWYAIGDMIGRSDAEKVAYTRWLFEETKPWDDGGIANVDAALKAAAAAYDAIGPYSGGLYDLYPQFVAQYLTEDRFYGKLVEVDLRTPDLYQASSEQSGGPFGPLATRAWRFRVQLARNASAMPYNVRFTVDALDGTDRDDLHLIVDEKVVPRPVDPTAPYADVQRTDLATPAASGAVEYLVRVANVAADAAETSDAGFSLRVEVDGFYGNDVSGGLAAGDTDAISGELPPGFAMRGPAPWSCNGSGQSRAIFDLVTPDELARGYDRSLPQAARNTENWLDGIEIMVKQAEDDGTADGMTREQLAAFRKQMESMVAAGRAEVQPVFREAADEARARRTTSLAATFVGQNADGECQMTVGARLAGRTGGAQVLAGAVDESLYPADEAPEFAIRVYPAGMLRALRAGIPTVHPLDPRRGDWEICTMTEAEQQRTRGLASAACPPVVCSAGRLTLEAAEQGRIAGTFEFDVVRWPEDRYGSACGTPLARDKVIGHFNVSSTDDGYDDGGIVTNAVPGAPIFELDID